MCPKISIRVPNVEKNYFRTKLFKNYSKQIMFYNAYLKSLAKVESTEAPNIWCTLMWNR